MPLSLLFVILTPLLVLVMIWAFARNAMAIKRDLDQRFEQLRSRLEADATEAVETLLRDRSGKNGSG